MRRTLVLAVAALALLGVVTPHAYAQAPAPTFKITGFIDTLTTYVNNTSNVDGDLRRKDREWYGRNRGRFDVIGEYGKNKAVLGLELDFVFGQTGAANTNIAAVGGGAAGGPGGSTTFAQFGTDGSFGLNTDVRGIIEIKWLYTELDLPFMPVPTVARIGAQPFGAAANYKLAVYANGDFAGANVVSTITPNVKAVATFVNVEERVVGRQCLGTDFGAVSCAGVNRFQLRGDDWAFIVAPEITPFRGLDIKPMYSYFTASGTTSGNARQSRGGINATTWFQNANTVTVAPNDNLSWRKGINEDRHTVGLDARWRSGPFSLDPTVLYQFGGRSQVAPSDGSLPAAFTDSGVIPGRKYNPKIDAWLIDIRGGFQLGPLLLEGLYMWTSGQHARNNTLNHIRYFQPLDTDTSYGGDWGGQLNMLGVDYLTALNEAGLSIAYPGVAIGYDKYGRHMISAKATYALTPTLSIMGGVAGHFTDKAMQVDGTPGANGLIPVFNCNGGRCPNGDSHYVGTELFGLLTYRFSPGVSWDNAAGYMFVGKAFDALTNPTTGVRDAHDAYILTSRIRFSF
jgi:hypothetical protein